MNTVETETSPPDIIFKEQRSTPDSVSLIRSRAAILYEGLRQEGRNLELPDHMILAKGRTKPPRTLDHFNFVPILPVDRNDLSCSLLPMKINITSSEGVMYEYDATSSRKPYVDAAIGLGMTYNERLVAVCAGGISPQGPIITQLQDVSNKVPPKTSNPEELRKFPYQNGLRDGIDWKLSLVRGWCSMVNTVLPDTVEEVIGQPTWVQSAWNNRWINKRERDSDGRPTKRRFIERKALDRLSATYDETAFRIGGVLDPHTKNIRLPAKFTIGAALT